MHFEHLMDDTETKPACATFDHRDDETAQKAVEIWEQLRAEGTLGRSDKHGGFLIASRYEDVCEVARNAVGFSSSVTNIPAVPQFFPLINHDPPMHAKYRAIVNPLLSPAALEPHATWTAAKAAELAGPLLASDRFDFAMDYALPLAHAFTLHQFGFDDAPHDLMDWVNDLILGVNGHDAAVEGGRKIGDYLRAQVAKRKDNLGQDLLSGLLEGRIDGAPLSEEHLIGYSMLLLTAGLETTASALTSVVYYLVNHPEVCREYVARPEIENLAMEEFVRWSTPFTLISRTATEDTTVSGCPVHAGDRVLLMWGSANRDKSAFDRADDVVLERFPNRHVGFGMGPHRCVGSHLAKMVMRAALRFVAPSLHEWRIEHPESLEWSPAEVRRLHHLPLVRVGVSS